MGRDGWWRGQRLQTHGRVAATGGGDACDAAIIRRMQETYGK